MATKLSRLYKQHTLGFVSFIYIYCSVICSYVCPQCLRLNYLLYLNNHCFVAVKVSINTAEVAPSGTGGNITKAMHESRSFEEA